jgi:hypothetical protein
LHTARSEQGVEETRGSQQLDDGEILDLFGLLGDFCDIGKQVSGLLGRGLGRSVEGLMSVHVGEEDLPLATK